MSTKKRSRVTPVQHEDTDEFVDPRDQDQLEASNVARVEPYQGMRLEIRDTDYIWSSGYLVKVTKKGKSKTKTMVTVAYDGWGRTFDEILQWPNDRLAKLYTYTKQVKCNLDLLAKNRSKPSGKKGDKRSSSALYSSVWPVTVQFRMPHPGVKHARDALLEEDKVFVKAYGVQHMPKENSQYMIHDGGCWFHHSRLRMWKEEPSTFGALHPQYMRAFKVAQQDKKIKGILVPKALEANSLLQDIYRVHDIRGCDTFDGVLRETEPPRKRQRLLVDNEEEANDAGSENPPSVVAIHNVVEEVDTRVEVSKWKNRQQIAICRF